MEAEVEAEAVEAAWKATASTSLDITAKPDLNLKSLFLGPLEFFFLI